jgi:bleomycin hydrolase
LNLFGASEHCPYSSIGRNESEGRLRFLGVILFLCEAGIALASSRGAKEISCPLLVAETITKYAQLVPVAVPASAQTPARYGQMSPHFKHNTHYRVMLPNQAAVTYQGALGTCHLHSWVSDLQRDYIQSTGREIKISHHYLSGWFALNRALKAIDSGAGLSDFRLFATPVNSRDAILEAGIIPDQVWKGSRDFILPQNVDLIHELMKNIITRTHVAIEKTDNADQRYALISTAKEQITDLFERNVGKFPTHFEFEGKTYTPQTFARERFPNLSRRLATLIINSEGNKRAGRRKKNGDLFIKTGTDEFESTARAMLDRGENVFLSFEHNGQYYHLETGVFSMSAFRFPSYATPLSRKQRFELGLKYPGHVVQIVGYDFDPATNKIIKWRIKDNHGAHNGDNGYKHMYNDYFRAFATGLAFGLDSARDLFPEMFN